MFNIFHSLLKKLWNIPGLFLKGTHNVKNNVRSSKKASLSLFLEHQHIIDKAERLYQ